MAQAIIRPDGRLECSSCGQALHESQTVCPLCKETITGVIAGRKKKEYTGRKPVARRRIPMYLLIVVVLFVLGYLGTMAWKNGWFSSQNGGASFSELTRPGGYGGGKNIGEFLLPGTNVEHTEEPVKPIDSNAIGYDFRLSQIFFETEEDHEKEAKIKAILDYLGLNYENLYYTDKGYYTADFIGLGPYTKKKYLEVVDEVKAAISDAMVTYELYGVSFTLEGWYTTP